MQQSIQQFSIINKIKTSSITQQIQRDNHPNKEIKSKQTQSITEQIQRESPKQRNKIKNKHSLNKFKETITQTQQQ